MAIAKGKSAKPASRRPKKLVKKPRKPQPEATPRIRVTVRPLLDRLIRFVSAFVCILVVIPAILLIVYKAEFIRPVSTLMIQEALIGNGAKREWIEIDDIAPVLYQSVVMSEDGKFCSHRGVDWDALNAVIVDAIDGEKTRGASTITMQLVKNLFLWPNRSYVRKALEVPYALLADFLLGKKRIMEIYLNIVEWDTGVFGANAAAQTYFGRNATKLSRHQAALLTVTLPNPKKRNAARPTNHMNRIAGVVRARAGRSGAYVTCLK